MITHGIVVDGLFDVVARDKVGAFVAGAPGLPADRPHTLAGAEAVAGHMERLGYRYTAAPPGLLLPGEMTIVRAAGPARVRPPSRLAYQLAEIATLAMAGALTPAEAEAMTRAALAEDGRRGGARAAVA